MVTNLTPQEEAILMPEYEKYLSGFLYPDYGEALSFDDWWRAKADDIKDSREGK